MNTHFNILASLFLGMIVLMMITHEFPRLRYTRTALYLGMQICTAALAASAIAYIICFVRL